MNTKKENCKTNENLLEVPDSKLPPIKEDFKKTFPWRIFKIMAEFIEGFEFISDFKKSVTILGSTNFTPDNHFYKEAEKLGKLLGKSGHTVITGGGPGIMEAANKGACESNADSIGMNIQLPEGQRSNKFINKKIGFHYFFIRKMMMSFSSSVYVFFPGGFGTLDEFFEMVVLVQTKKIDRKVKIIAVGKDFWESLYDWIEKDVYLKQKAIEKKDLSIVKIVDSAEEAIKIINKK